MAQQRGRKRRADGGSRSTAPAAPLPSAKPEPIATHIDITLGTGIVVRAHAVPIFLIQEVSQRALRPQPPMVDLGDGREEENLSDPTYIAKLEEWTAGLYERLNDAFLLFGVDVVDVPENCYEVDDDSWVKMVAAVGLEVREGPMRKVDWLKLYACRGAADTAVLAGSVSLRSGVPENEVEAAAAIFQRGAEQGTDRKSSADGDDS